LPRSIEVCAQRVKNLQTGLCVFVQSLRLQFPSFNLIAFQNLNASGEKDGACADETGDHLPPGKVVEKTPLVEDVVQEVDDLSRFRDTY
jgi:hypothetical protein